MSKFNTIKEMIEYVDSRPEIREDMESIFFCADLHHGHDKIVDIKGRPCSHLMHEEWLVDLFNQRVQKKHTTYLIGDVSFSRKPDAERFIDRLNGNKFLILGNHDKNIDKSTRFSQIIQIKDFTYSRFDINIHIVLCHYPIASWNRKVHGSWHLYGHVHGTFENSGLSWDTGIDNTKDVVGFDGNKYHCFHQPINLYEVANIMAVKEDIYLQQNNVK